MTRQRLARSFRCIEKDIWLYPSCVRHDAAKTGGFALPPASVASGCDLQLLPNNARQSFDREGVLIDRKLPGFAMVLGLAKYLDRQEESPDPRLFLAIQRDQVLRLHGRDRLLAVGVELVQTLQVAPVMPRAETMVRLRALEDTGVARTVEHKHPAGSRHMRAKLRQT